MEMPTDMDQSMDEDSGEPVEDILTEVGTNSEQKFIGGVMNKVGRFPQA